MHFTSFIAVTVACAAVLSNAAPSPESRHGTARMMTRRMKNAENAENAAENAAVHAEAVGQWQQNMVDARRDPEMPRALQYLSEFALNRNRITPTSLAGNERALATYEARLKDEGRLNAHDMQTLTTLRREVGYWHGRVDAIHDVLKPHISELSGSDAKDLAEEGAQAVAHLS